MEQVVFLTKRDGIAYVALEEREFRNTFTDRFLNGLKTTFASIDEDPEIKVVVVHGYDNYFCCGGTKEELVELYEGYTGARELANFTDSQLHDLFLRCKVPVISAMQGHALGAGLALGCYADIIVMAEEAIYATNFMRYGFTPGFGASYIVPLKLGNIAGQEMLYTARNFYGNELKERGAPVKIVPKLKVLDTADSIARDMASKPSLSLRLLKESLTSDIKKKLPEVIETELEMHRQSFAQPEVIQRIEGMFGN